MHDRTRSGLLLVASLVLAMCVAAPAPREEDHLLSVLEQARRPATAQATLAPAGPVQPRAQLIYAPTACRPIKGANPMIWLPPQAPRVGEPVHLSVLTTQLEPRPDLLVVVAIGPDLLRPSFDLTASGAPGCHLLVSWTSIAVLFPTQQSVGMWEHVGPGRWDLNWTPAPMNANQVFYVQAAVSSARDNRSGVTFTSAAELWVAGP